MTSYMSVAEVANRFRVSKMTVYRLIEAGELPVLRIGRQFRVPTRAVDDYTDLNTVQHQPVEVAS